MQYGSNQPSRANLNSSLVVESQSAGGINKNPPSALGMNKSLDHITYNPEELNPQFKGGQGFVNSAQSRREESARLHGYQPQYYSTNVLNGAQNGVNPVVNGSPNNPYNYMAMNNQPNTSESVRTSSNNGPVLARGGRDRSLINAGNNILF